MRDGPCSPSEECATYSATSTDHLLRDLHGPEQFRNSEFYRRFLFYVYIKYLHNRKPPKHL